MNLAKNFETKFKKDWEKSCPNGFCLRLADQMNGYKTTSQNPSDFICYNFPKFYFMEIKTHKGASIPFDAIPQYDRLLKFNNIKGVYCGVIVWFYEKDKVVYIPISTIKEMKENGQKSFGIRHLSDNNYKYIEIPSIKKIVFMDSDYSVLINELEVVE